MRANEDIWDRIDELVTEGYASSRPPPSRGLPLKTGKNGCDRFAPVSLLSPEAPGPVKRAQLAGLTSGRGLTFDRAFERRWICGSGGDVDSGDKLDLSVDAQRPAIQPKPAFLNSPAQETR
jgi:hypothetical protein